MSTPPATIHRSVYRPGRFVVIFTTPFPPRIPYNATSAGFLSTSIRSMSDGLRKTMPRDPGGRGVSSTMYRGASPPKKLLAPPLIRIWSPPFVVRETCTPGNLPAKRSSIVLPSVLVIDAVSAASKDIGRVGRVLLLDAQASAATHETALMHLSERRTPNIAPPVPRARTDRPVSSGLYKVCAR